MTAKLGMTHQQLIESINSDINEIKDQGSKIITKEFPASETETSSVQLDTKCQGKDYMFVFMDYVILEPSQYSLSSDGLTVNFSPAIPANHKLLVRYFSYVNLATIPNGLFLGQIIQVPFGIDESKNIGRYLNGQIIIQDQFKNFTKEVKSWVSLRASLFCTETEWQEIKAASKLGQCGKFVVDDTAGTIRLPCVVNAQGLVDLTLIGGIKNESLPNITGEVGYAGDLGFLDADVTRISGAFKKGQTTIAAPTGQNKSSYALGFDASLSSSTYQDNAPVQQEAIQYPYVIVVNTGVEEAERPINNYQVNNVYSYGMSQYYKGDMTNLSWLKSAGQWNSGTVYAGMYNWLVEQVNAGKSGFVASTATYTDYDFVINTTDQTFRLPLLNGEENLPGSTFTDMTLNSSTETNNYNFSVTKNCFIVLRTLGMTSSDSAGTMIRLQTNTHMSYCTNASTKTNTAGVSIFAKKGESVNVGTFGAWGTLDVFRQYDAVGNGNLYYYVGDTLQNASLINVARIEEKLTDVNAASRGYLVESYHNGTEWYRVYSDGWIEQGGHLLMASAGQGISHTVTFLKQFTSTEYTVTTNILRVGGDYSVASHAANLKKDKFDVVTNYSNVTSGGDTAVWYACGY